MGWELNFESFQNIPLLSKKEFEKAVDFFTGSGHFELIDLVPSLHRELEKLAFYDPKLRSDIEEDGANEGFPTHLLVYPWQHKVVHVLRPEYFVRLRTSRNEYKLTREEMTILKGKRIGVVGLSAGASVASALVQERICGDLRLADFDILELSNLNRISDSILHIGNRKTDNLKRKLLELDPFMQITCFDGGITSENTESFFLDSGKIDLLVEVCDNLELKVALRAFAKKLGIPVVMETSDKGMLDVERFDLEPNRPLFHGLLDEERFVQITDKAERSRFVFSNILDPNHISPRGLFSLSEIGKSIGTWPQLGTDVLAGGAHCALVCREILLGRHTTSGRWYIDVSEMIHKPPFLSGKSGSSNA
jgi:molybdopterin/thiamine biosynthesis adenylyltransferase